MRNALANAILHTVQVLKEKGAGPTGPRHLGLPIPTVTCYSTEASPVIPLAVTVLNEAVVTGEHVADGSAAVYLCDDCTFCWTTETCPVSSDQLTHTISDTKVEFGFTVTDRVPSSQLSKVIGFDLRQSASRFLSQW